MQVLCVLSVISASVYFDGVAHVCGYLATASLDHPNVVFGTCAEYQCSIRYNSDFKWTTLTASYSAFDSYGAVGWSLALTFTSAVWTVFSIFHLFFQFRVLSRNKACCRIAWTIFSLMVSTPQVVSPSSVCRVS